MKKIVFMGTPDYAKEILEKIIKTENFEVVLVITQPDKPVGRKKILTSPPVKILANKYNIKVIQPISLKDKKIIEEIRIKEPDFIVVAAFGMLLPKEVLNIAPCINLHASILPKYRGASPIQQTILDCNEFGGVTAMLMDRGLDTGQMLGFSYIKIKNYRFDELLKILSKEAANLTILVLDEYEKLNPIKQLHANASLCKKIKKEDGLINLDSAVDIFRKFRAFFGWPGVFFENGMKLIDIELIDKSSINKPGEILTIIDESVIIGCKQGKIKINILQPKSKPKMSAKAYILGQRKRVGDNLF